MTCITADYFCIGQMGNVVFMHLTGLVSAMLSVFFSVVFMHLTGLVSATLSVYFFLFSFFVSNYLFFH